MTLEFVLALPVGLQNPLAAFLLGPLGIGFAALWGALWGSFFNVMIARLPRGASLVRPGSHCFACGAAVRWYDNIPLLSFLWLRGRCRDCGARFSARYLLVEALVAGLAVLMHHTYVTQGHGDLALRAGQLVITSLFCGLLVAISFIDLDTMRIPDVITYPSIPICMGLSVFMGHPHLWDGAVGGVAGYLLIRLIADGYELLTKRQGMGYGDAKLLAMIGGLLGWQAIFPTILLASLQGSVIGISILAIVRRRAGNAPEAATEQAEEEEDEEEQEDEEEDALEDDDDRLRYARIPFGPFLCLAALEVMLLRDMLPDLLPFFYRLP